MIFKQITLEKKEVILYSLFIMFLCAAVLLGSKIINIFGLTFSAGTIPAALTFPITDAIAEKWGKEKAKQIVFASIISWIALLIIIQIAILLPAADFYEFSSEYNKIFTTSSRIIVGSFIAYIIAQYHDIWLYLFIKKKTNKKMIWLRNNISTIISQLINTILIVLIGFAGSIPLKGIFITILGWWLIKVIIAVFDTPIVYIILYWLNKGNHNRTN